ncbi:aromatic amino acid exporter YddG [Kiloniella sp. b19]|uniref:aromatic amino acid exporter YddG n=1 Tax=Kiloniella sp. GXU_MW_B19 TaxID=3141326 RepID=UPI0031DA75C6
MQNASNSMRATLIGTVAIVLWGILALLTAKTNGIGPFQLLFMTFSIGGSIGLFFLFSQGRDGLGKLQLPLKVWIFGVAGLFGYHFFYFTALKHAPVEQASLIAYLWPLLIVLFSAFLPGEKLRWFHIAGGLLGLAGAAALVMDNQTESLAFSDDYTVGYLSAIACALIWSSYSVYNKTQASVPTEAVAVFCILTALLSGMTHLFTEEWIFPDPGQGLAIAGLGAGPVGLAFYAWDHGTKNGNIRLLGVWSYATPLLSTLVLIFFGFTEASLILLLSCLLICGGAALASLDLLTGKKRT